MNVSDTKTSKVNNTSTNFKKWKPKKYSKGMVFQKNSNLYYTILSHGVETESGDIYYTVSHNGVDLIHRYIQVNQLELDGMTRVE